MSQTDLLALLAQAHPGASQGDLLAMLDNIPDKATQKPASARSGSRPRTDASMERRRLWASSGRMPPRLACRFTLAEQAVLAVVADQIGKSATVSDLSACDLTLDHIAALAGVCRSTVRNALRQAVKLQLIRVQERRLSAWRNAPNLVTIISPEWLSWLKLRTSRRREVSGGGRKSVQATNTEDKKKALRRAERRPNPATSGTTVDARNVTGRR